jgi:hypothetical protein
MGNDQLLRYGSRGLTPRPEGKEVVHYVDGERRTIFRGETDAEAAAWANGWKARDVRGFGRQRRP